MTLNLVEHIEQASEEFEEATRLTPKQAADLARQYWQLKQARWVTDDGEILTQDQMAKRTRQLNEQLKAHIQREGVLDVEGIPPLMVQERSTETIDILSLAEYDRATFDQLLHANGLLPNMEVVKGLERANLIGKVRRMPVGGTPALVFDKRGWRAS